MTDWTSKRCRHMSGDADRVSSDAAAGLLGDLDGWSLHDGGKAIRKTAKFENYYETMAFVNALAWVAHREDHHPDLQVGYNRCTITLSTHSVGGLSENDFICAAKIDALA